MTFFHLWSIKEDILKNADKKYNVNQNLLFLGGLLF